MDWTHQSFPMLFVITCLCLPLFYNSYSLSAKCGSNLSYRLPENIKPDYYRISIITNLADSNESYTFSGNVIIQIKCSEATKKIVLHSKNLQIDKDSVSVKNILEPYIDESGQPKETVPVKGNALPIRDQCQNDENEFYIITLKKKLKPGLMYSISMEYSGELTEGLSGYYRSSYEDRKTGETKWIAVTQFQSTDARRAFPCFDEPSFKAKFEVRLGHIESRKSISNMRIANTVPIDGMSNWVWDQYEVSVPMSTYLVAFIISDFEYKMSEEQSGDNVTFKVWARNDAINQVDYAALVGPRILKHYESYFGLKYPLPKLDMVAIPDFNAGAMENWGLITFREVALLYDPAASTAFVQPYVASVVAHELAHQWFGNLVTMKWWTDLWLNEGFATYVASLGVHNLHPEWDSLNEAVVDNMLNVFSLDSLKSSHPISVPIGHPRLIDEIFDAIAYKKGSSIIRMMDLFLGEETFMAGVNNYLNKHMYKNAEQDDLWESLTEEAHKNKVLDPDLTVKGIMDTWTLQTGYPLITVTKDPNTGLVTVKQERFLADKANSMDAGGNDGQGKWWVPLSFTTQTDLDFSNTTPKKWLRSDSETTEIEGLPKDDWVIFNIQMGGYYRVNYDQNNWDLLTNTLKTDHQKIGMLNRVLLIEDSLTLAKRGDIKYSVPFNILQYLKAEEDYLPWKAALNNLSFLGNMLSLSPSFENFKAFINNLLKDIYDKIGNQQYENTPENLIKIKHQSLIGAWACKYDVSDCKEKAISAFKEWMDKGVPVPKDSQSYVYCTAIRYGGEEEWNFLWEKYVNSNSAAERTVILSTLGCTEKTTLLNKYLDWSLDDKSGVRKQDSLSVFMGIAKSNYGYSLAKSFYQTNLKKMADYFGSDNNKIGHYFKILASRITSEQDRAEMSNFVDENKEIFRFSMKGVEQGLESAKVNIQWHQQFHDEINGYLTAQN